MKLAAVDFIVWLIIAVVVMVAKGFGKLTTPGEDETESEDQPPRPSVPRARPATRSATPRPVVHDEPPAIPVQIRRMMEQLAQPKHHVAPPPIAAPVESPAKAPPAPRPTPAPAPAAPRSNRSTQWATALRDKSNVRNIIIAAEIIGPPKGDC